MVFIDNKEKYFEPTKKFGLNTILFLNNKQLIKDLGLLGIKIR